MATLTKFKTKSGRLTPYALACGYLEQHETPEEVVTTLWHEGACYHVRQHDHKERGRIFWESFDTLTEARKRFDLATK